MLMMDIHLLPVMILELLAVADTDDVGSDFGFDDDEIAVDFVVVDEMSHCFYLKILPVKQERHLYCDLTVYFGQ